MTGLFCEAAEIELANGGEEGADSFRRSKKREASESLRAFRFTSSEFGWD
jgi:hypothetical protein